MLIMYQKLHSKRKLSILFSLHGRDSKKIVADI
jgi:hypothetical protein